MLRRVSFLLKLKKRCDEMEVDKEFLDSAIVEVYKKSVIEEDEYMKQKTLNLIHSDLFSNIEKEYKLEQIKEIENQFKQEEYVCYIDGSVDNQSDEVRAGAGFVIYLDEDIFYKYQFNIPTEHRYEDEVQKTSSHIAEYQSLAMLLRVLRGKLLKPEHSKITVYTDSDVLVGQYYAEYRITNNIQKELRRTIFELVKHFKDVELKWIPREENKLANHLAQATVS